MNWKPESVASRIPGRTRGRRETSMLREQLQEIVTECFGDGTVQEQESGFKIDFDEATYFTMPELMRLSARLGHLNLEIHCYHECLLISIP